MTGESTLKQLLKSRIKHSPLGPLLLPRRFHAFCLGPPKTGTTSIAAMLRRHYRSEHEPLEARTRELVRAAHAGSASREALVRQLRWRDRELYLEMESSHPMTVAAGLLAEAFPTARFVLVVREPLPWLDSIINMRLNRAVRRFEPVVAGQPMSIFRELNEIYFRRRYPEHPPEERSLAEQGLFTLDGYLSGWAEYYRQVLDHVPADRMLVLPLHDLSARPERLTSFLGIPADTLDRGASHANRAEARHGVLERFAPEYIEAKIERHCRPVLDTLAGRV